MVLNDSQVHTLKLDEENTLPFVSAVPSKCLYPARILYKCKEADVASSYDLLGDFKSRFVLGRIVT